MKIALIGYGSTGKVVAQVAPDTGVIISDIFTSGNKFTDVSHLDANVVVDFSIASEVISHVEKAAQLGKNIVIGTTGWHDKFDVVKSIVENSGIGCVFGSNFSIGANLFFRIVAEATSIIDASALFDISISEVHHRLKADSPSGTALTLAQIVLEHAVSKKNISAGNLNRVIEPHELHISSLRHGTVYGKHTVGFDGASDTIELSHTAKNRNGFALGALSAATWVEGKKGMYDFSEMFLAMITEQKNGQV